mgnify:CR=1 FL=1
MSTDKGLVSLIVKYNSALSDPQRIKMLKIMGSSPLNTVSVSDIARILEISQPSATKHLQILHAHAFALGKPFGSTCWLPGSVIAAAGGWTLDNRLLRLLLLGQVFNNDHQAARRALHIHFSVGKPQFFEH